MIMWLEVIAIFIPVTVVIINIIYLIYDKRKLSRELEKYKGELNLLNQRHSVQFSYLHVERAKLLRELYRLIVRLHEAIHIWINRLYLPDGKGVYHEKDDDQRRIEEVSKYLNELIALFNENKILLPNSLQEIIASLINKDEKMCLDHKFKLYLAKNPNEPDAYKNLMDATQKYDAELNKPLDAIESEFMKLLAVNFYEDD